VEGYMRSHVSLYRLTGTKPELRGTLGQQPNDSPNRLG